MPRKAASAVDALNTMMEEQRLLAERVTAARDAAALELGHIVLGAGGGELTTRDIEAAIVALVKAAGAGDAKRHG